MYLLRLALTLCLLLVVWYNTLAQSVPSSPDHLECNQELGSEEYRLCILDVLGRIHIERDFSYIDSIFDSYRSWAITQDDQVLRYKILQEHGTSHLIRGERDPAMALFDQVTHHYENKEDLDSLSTRSYVIAKINKAVLHKRNGNLELAITELENNLIGHYDVSNSENYLIKGNLATLYENSGRYYKLLNLTRELAPIKNFRDSTSYSLILSRTGKALNMLNLKKQSRDKLEESLQYVTGQTQLMYRWNTYGYLIPTLSDLHDDDKLTYYIKQISIDLEDEHLLEIEPFNIALVKHLLYYYSGDVDKGLYYLEQAISIEDNNRKSNIVAAKELIMACNVYLDRKDTIMLKKHYNQLVKLDKNLSFSSQLGVINLEEQIHAVYPNIEILEVPIYMNNSRKKINVELGKILSNNILDITTKAEQPPVANTNMLKVILIGLLGIVILSFLILRYFILKSKRRRKTLYKQLDQIKNYHQILKHDIMSPLHILETEIEGSTGSKAVELQMIQKIKQIVKHLDLTKSLTEQTLDIDTIPLDSLLKDIVYELSFKYDTAQYDIKIEQIETVTTDISLLRRILFNVLENALKFSQKAPKPTISIKQSKTNGYNTIQIEDNGVGVVDLVANSQMTQPGTTFHRQSEGSKTGYGLYICSVLIEKLSGKITFRKSPLGGLSVHISLP